MEMSCTNKKVEPKREIWLVQKRVYQQNVESKKVSTYTLLTRVEPT